ncbi:MAG: FtsW/RodA/SpoVE family cell cycle protein, partial [Spirochaetaceae bacterium]|nr:FtsW/RodA/SpoVE family cell cycle protein [Spirochaetaceae bacterium]
MIKKRREISFQNYDLILLLSVIILSVIGIFFIYSSGVSSQGVSLSREYIKQIVWVVTGIILMILFSIIDYRRLKLLALLVFAGAVGLLFLTLLWGSVINGAKSWLGIGTLGIQPSEFSKIAVILFLASFLEDNHKEMKSVKTIMLAFLIVGIPSSLIILQPDLGTAMVMGPIFFAMIFIGGCDIKHLAFLLLTLFLVIFFTLFHAWNIYINPNSMDISRLFVEPKLIISIIVIFALLSILSLIGYA